MGNRLKSSPLFWSILILVLAQALDFSIAFRQKAYVVESQISSPNLSLSIAVFYFLATAGVLGIVLLLIPLRLLKHVLRIMFMLLFSWGTFIVLVFLLPFPAAATIAAAGGILWLLWPAVWIHNLLLVLTLVGSGSVFGFLFAPWTFVAFMLIISVYDVLAVRFGYMLWMAKKMSDSDTLPAFIIPKQLFVWKLKLGQLGFKQAVEAKSSEREFAVLGGGDIGFPLMLTVSVFFAYGFRGAVIVAAFSLIGLACAFWLQSLLLKDKPMPALPPISAASLIGFSVAYFL